MKQPQSIAILGAGIMGLMAAYTLKKAMPDTPLTLFDKEGFPPSNASSKAGGMLAPYAELDHMPHEYLPASMRSIEIWNEIQESLQTNFEFRQNGSLIIAHPEDRHLLSRFSGILPKDKNWSAVQARDIEELEPDLNIKTFSSGLLLQTEAHLHPRKAMAALYDALPDITILQNTPEQLSEKFDLVIDCRGMGAQEHHTDLRGVKGEVLIVYNPDFHLSRPLRLMHPRYPVYIVPRDGNIFMIGATIIESADNENISIRSAMELQSALYSLHPSFAESEILEMSAGIRPAFADNMPKITMKKRIISCNGLFRHGFLLSPVLAECLIDLIQAKDSPFVDLLYKDIDDEYPIEWQAASA